MQKMTANQAKQNFGELLDKAQRGPVEITKHGRRVGILVADADYHSEAVQLEPWMVEKIKKGMAQFERGEGIPAEEVYAKMRKKIRQWERERTEVKLPA
ncbi:MAG: type II toxin-antitoxin system prevent-host-death family antitoxin [Robiginitomaculum sp.]|nr:type II toxin-antitoxin system prevent-host-death family antitoxin [Robiginitomaculum sp.]